MNLKPSITEDHAFYTEILHFIAIISLVVVIGLSSFSLKEVFLINSPSILFVSWCTYRILKYMALNEMNHLIRRQEFDKVLYARFSEIGMALHQVKSKVGVIDDIHD